MTDAHRIAVYGATGYTGRRVVDQLAKRGATPILVGRDRQRLESVAGSVTDAEAHVAALDDAKALRDAVEGCAAVINAAGPFATSAAPVVSAALDAGAHYLDFTAEQEVVVDLFESWDAPAREAGVAVIPSMGFYGALGDLLASITSDGLRCDRITIAYAVDGWLLTAGSRETAPLMSGQRRAWRDGNLVLDRGEPRFGSFYYPGRPSEGTMEDYPLPEAITVPRHAPTREVRLLMAVATLQAIFSPDAPQPQEIDDEARAASRFTLVVEAESAEQDRRTIASGRDIYGITAPIITEGALRLVDSQLTGTLAPAEAFDAADLLRTLIPEWLTIEPALDPGGERPVDAAAFVFAAERATNERDSAAAASLYAHDATLEVITDGALACFRGSQEIGDAWRRYMEAIDEAGLVIRKQLVAAGQDVIANEWRGTANGGDARGTEAWFFDAQGKVREHRLLTSLNVQVERT